MKTKKEREKYREILKTLPEDIKDIAAAEKTRDLIDEVCKKFKISKKSEDITDYVGDVFFGLLAPDDFQEVLEKEIEIETGTAKRVATEIYRYVFYPVKESLEKLYRMEIAPLAKMPVIQRPSERPVEPLRKDDVYREPIGGEEKKDV